MTSMVLPDASTPSIVHRYEETSPSGSKELVASKVAIDPEIGGDGVVDQSGTGGRFAIITEAERFVLSPHAVSYTHLTLPTIYSV